MAALKKLFAFILVLLPACTEKDNPPGPSLPDYDLTNPVIIKLNTDLDEISGILYYPKDTSIFAINDELGILYKIYIRKQIKIKRWKFSIEGDYEDIALYDSTFYALQSNGNLKGFKFTDPHSFTIEDCTVPIQGENNFETLYYDSEQQKLILICKNCEADNKNEVSSYAFNPLDHTFTDQPYFVIDSREIGEQLGRKKFKFQPSAAAIHPKTKELYIISAENKCIVVADRNGKVREAYKLDARLFKQPEGITFTPAGDMLISNEAAEIGTANILIFKYKPEVNEKG